MKKHFYTLLVVIAVIPAHAQLTVNSSLTPQQLVQNYLVGTGVTVSNVTFNGAPGSVANPQAGYFNSSAANVGINEGIILASGDVSNAIGPNDDQGITTPYGSNGSDPDLATISGLNISDEAILEFDFVPTGDTIEFRFAFASDEYMEYVGGGINDAFGIFVSGPGISGPFSNNAENMALIPGTSTFVTIDNVNLNMNASYYIDNGDGFTPPFNTNPFYIQYDGITVVITSKFPVQCGLTYHIKFAIGDGFDDALDSGVFIEGGSFSSNGVNVNLNVPALPNTPYGVVYEGCTLNSQVNFLFVRPDTLQNDTAYFQIGGNAINGSDYSFIPNYVVFGPGQDSTILTISIPDDGIVEGTDTLSLAMVVTSACGSTVASAIYLYIEDSYTVMPFAGNDTAYYCVGNVLSFNGIILAGNPPYNFNWSNGTSGAATSVTITQLGNDTLILEVTDACGFFGADTLYISQAPLPNLIADAGPDQIISCPGQTITLDGSYYNSVVPTSYNWDGIVSDSIYVVQPLTTTQYIFNVTNTCNQFSSDTVTVIVPPYTPLSVMLSDTVLTGICPGDTATVSAAAAGGTAPYNYFWSNGDTDSLTAVPVFQDSILLLTVTDVCGLDTTVSVAMELNTPAINFEVTGGRHCRNEDSTVIIPYTLSGGNNPFTFTHYTTVSYGNITVDPSAGVITIGYPSSGVYYTTVTDVCGTTATDSAAISMIDCSINIPNVISPNNDGSNDLLVIDGLQYHPNSIIKVYNRWGVLVYSDTDYQNNWNGGGLPAGVYYYIIELTDGTVPAMYNGFLHIFY